MSGTTLETAKPRVTAKDYVKSMYPQTGAELSAMHGWRIINYAVTPPQYLNRGTKSEAAAWRSIARRHGSWPRP